MTTSSYEFSEWRPSSVNNANDAPHVHQVLATIQGESESEVYRSVTEPFEYVSSGSFSPGPPTPFTYEGDMVRIRPEVLVVDDPVAFVYDGVPVMAIKRDDETVEFYYKPSE